MVGRDNTTMAPKRKANENDQAGAGNPSPQHDHTAEAVTASGDYTVGF